MTVQEFYETIGGDYTAALKTLMNDNIASKFIIRFLDDKTYDELLVSFENENIEDMFRNSHTLKGVASNLGFKKLIEKAVILTDALRENSPLRTNIPLLKECLADVTFEYKAVIEKINYYKENK